MKQMKMQREGEWPSRCIFCVDMVHGDKRAHLTIEGFEEKARVSTRTISHLRTQEHRNYSPDWENEICIALQSLPWMLRKMLARAGFFLRSTK